MALKDWKKRGNNYYIRKNENGWIRIKKGETYTFRGKQKVVNGFILPQMVWSIEIKDGFNRADVSDGIMAQMRYDKITKEFKTRTESLKYVKKYMETH